MFVDQVSDRLHAIPAWWLIGIVATILISRLVINKYGGGLNHIPGPTLAPWTDLWRAVVVGGRRPELEHIRLHEKYGSLVRLGPRVVSLSDPAAIQVIYALNAGFVKSGFYPVQQTVAKGRRLFTLFSTTDEKFHAKLRRAVSNAYAMSTLVQFEPLVDSTTLAFLDQLQKRFADRPGPEGTCDFGTWLQFYAFDVIGELTYSKRLGFVDKGVDVDGIIGNLEWLLNYAAVVRAWNHQTEVRKMLTKDFRWDKFLSSTACCSRILCVYLRARWASSAPTRRLQHLPKIELPAAQTWKKHPRRCLALVKESEDDETFCPGSMKPTSKTLISSPEREFWR